MTGGGFADHFSEVAAGYSAARPGYPDDLFAWAAGLPARRGTVWEVGCGGGQATTGLARHFARVHATEPSAAQIANAPALDKVTYHVATAEASGLAAGSVDLVFAAQAAHWFDHAAFHAEVRRVARPGAAVVLVSYGVLTVGPAVDAVIADFRAEVAAHWPPERAHVEDGYARLPFPFAEVAAPALAMRADWPLARLVAYLGTWSAVKRYREATGDDPLPRAADALAAAWGEPETAHPVAWPLAVRAGHVAPDG